MLNINVYKTFYVFKINYKNINRNKKKTKIYNNYIPVCECMCVRDHVLERMSACVRIYMRVCIHVYDGIFCAQLTFIM